TARREKQTQFSNEKMKLNFYPAKDYKNERLSIPGQYRPNSPHQRIRAFTNQRENKLVVLSINQKDYVPANSLPILPGEQESSFSQPITPNSLRPRYEPKNEKQTQISRVKMNIS
ncbi:MAG: hypothetical protein ACYSSO_05085, partial [Planctomycetota bacterium]